MDLAGLPNDIDYNWYVEETNKILTEIGYYKTEKQQRFFWLNPKELLWKNLKFIS